MTAVTVAKDQIYEDILLVGRSLFGEEGPIQIKLAINYERESHCRSADAGPLSKSLLQPSQSRNIINQQFNQQTNA